MSTLLSNAPAYLYRCRNEPEWPNEFVSDHAFELTGHTPEELTDGSVMFTDLIVEEDRGRVWDEVQAGLAERRRFELRYSVRRKDGEVRHVEERGQGVYGEDGRVEAIEGVVYDVTERVRAEEALKDAEERYRILVERIPAVTFVDRVEGSEKPLYVSPQIGEMLGYTPEEWMAGRLWRERLHPEDRERILASDERFEADGERVDEEYRPLAKDGSVVWVREETVLVRGEEGEPLYVQGILTDVTEHKETEERVRASEAELRALFEAMTDLIFEIDWDGRYLKIAPTNPSLLYRPPGELLGKTLHEIMPAEQADMFRDHIRRALRTRRKVDTEYSLTIGDKEVWFAGTIAPMAEDRVVFVARDITERRRAEEELRKSQAGLAEAQRMAHLGNWEWDPRTGEIYWSDETFRIYGYEPQSFVPTFERLLEVVHPDDRKMLSQALERAHYDDRPYDFEHRVVKPDGEVRVVHRQAEVVRDAGGEPTRMVGTVHDVTERKALENQLQYQAMHDRLTGLPNRALFTDRLRQALTRAKRREGETAVLFMDLDNFKVVNDSLGHKAGDRLLVAAGKRVRTLLRPEDTVARLGGDEFIFLLEGTDTQGAVHVAERVLERLLEPFPLGGRRVVVTASIGVATGGANGKYAADLLRDADLAMYRAKRAGKARHAVFEEAMNAEAIERLEMEQDLRRAIERGELRVHYQPQMLLDANLQRSLRARGSRAIVSSRAPREPRITGVEALVRWEHPERGLL
ncbi:MAG TPA: PAS domain-containing protein, partial [Rubrobacter sp.]|nr:PAS domain-containing protein [Rubrobacter sp.]